MSIYKVYCDESRQHKQNLYKVIGSIWIKKEFGWKFVNKYLSFCKETVGKMPAHIKWTNIPSKPDSKYMPFYTGLVDLYFEENNKNPENIMFRAVVVSPEYIFNHKDYNDGDFETGFYKVYYQLLYHQIKEKPKYEYHIRPGSRPVSKKNSSMSEIDRLEELKKILNNSILNYNPVVSIEPRNAKDRILIQLADIFMGVTGYLWNEEHRKPKPHQGKLFLVEYITNKLNKPMLGFSTSKYDRTFNIFYFNP